MPDNIPKNMPVRFSEMTHFPRNSPDFFEITILQALEAFLRLRKNDNTRQAYRRDITPFFADILHITHLWELGNVPLDVLIQETKEYIFSFQKIASHKEDKILNPKTLRRKAYSLSAFFRYIMEVYNYPYNPVNNRVLDLPKEPKRSSTQSLTFGEIRDTLQYAKGRYRRTQEDFRNYLILCCLFLLALRREEAAQLQWEDIHKGDTTYIRVWQKGGSYKELPLPIGLEKSLDEYKAMFLPDSPYIFTPLMNNRTKELKKPLSSKMVFYIVRKIVSKVVPEKHITPHSFRKTFIEIALNNNQDFISIINATGHSTVEMVKYYDTRDVLKNNAINVVGNLV